MIIKKHWFSLVILIFLMNVFGGVVYGGELVSFSWAFFLKSEGGQVESLDFSEPESVSVGEQLRIYIELHEKSFVYLYLFDSKDDLYLVFPPSGSFYNGDFPSGYRTYIPSGNEWFVLDNFNGTEQFYLLASNNRLNELEKLTDNFLATRDPDLMEELLGEVEKIAGIYSVGSNYKIDSSQVSYGSRLNVSKAIQTVNAHAVSATDNYGVFLELVNK